MSGILAGLPTSSAVAPRDRNTGRFLASRIGIVSTYAASLVSGIAIWALLSSFYPEFVLPSPVETFHGFIELSADGTLWDSVVASSARILSGWSIGLMLGVPIGLAMGRISVIRHFADPYIEFFRYIPPVAFVTVSIVWFGVGELSKVVLIIYTTLFVVTINTLVAARSVDELKLRAAASLGATRWQQLGHVILPATLPGIVTGARVAMGNSFLTIVAAELVAAQSGLGAMIWQSRNFGRTDWVFVGIFMLGVLGFAFDRVLRVIITRGLSRYGVKA